MNGALVYCQQTCLVVIGFSVQYSCCLGNGERIPCSHWRMALLCIKSEYFTLIFIDGFHFLNFLFIKTKQTRELPIVLKRTNID